jgi:hypothetical protein
VRRKLNCWEYKKCGRQPGGEKSQEFGVCPAATVEKYDRVHDGKYGGRACWAVAGSLCGGHIQGVYAQKMINCTRCDFYSMVKSEEESGGHGFVITPIGMHLYLRNRFNVNKRATGSSPDPNNAQRVIGYDKISEIETRFLPVVGRAGVTMIDNVFAELLYKRGTNMTKQEFLYFVMYLLNCLSYNQRSGFLSAMLPAIAEILQFHQLALSTGGFNENTLTR